MAKNVIDVHGTMLFIPPFSEPDAIAEIIEDFSAYLPSCRPEYWAFGEPVNREFDMLDIRSTLQNVRASNFLWRRRGSPRGWGAVYRRVYPLRGPKHAYHYFNLWAKSNDQIETYLSYLKHGAGKFGVDYACCDTLSPMYKRPAMLNQLSPHGGNLTVYTHTLTRWVPDIVWGQIFGPAYVRLFGLQKLLSAPAYKVEEIGSDMVYLQLSESLFDMHGRYGEVDDIRQRVKAHLDDNIFFDPNAEADHVYRTPQFDFPT